MRGSLTLLVEKLTENFCQGAVLADRIVVLGTQTIRFLGFHKIRN